MPNFCSLQFFISFVFGLVIGAFFSWTIGIHSAFGLIFGGIFSIIGFCVNGCIERFFPQEDND